MTHDMWEDNVIGIASWWKFHHACGTLDDKHMAIKCWKKMSESILYNYEDFFSIIHFGLVNSNYKFLQAHIDANGSASDAPVINASLL